MTERILGPVTLFCGASAGSPRTYRLPPRAGGDGVGQLTYAVRVLDVKSASIARVAVKVQHGPDGTVSAAHSTPIATTTVASAPTVITGSAGTGMFAPYLHVILEIDRVSGSADEWVTLELYETRKALA